VISETQRLAGAIAGAPPSGEQIRAVRTGLDYLDGKVLMDQAVVNQMIAGHERQLKLINSLLEAHHQDMSGILLHREVISLSPLVETAVQDIQPLMAQRQATTHINISAELPLVRVDPVQLRRVYDNLITHALQYNRPGLCITLEAMVKDRPFRAIAQGSYLRCTVKDNGFGRHGTGAAGSDRNTYE